MKENLINPEDENELINIEEPKDDNLNKINTIKSLNSEENNQNININNLEKNFSLKSQNSLFSEFKNTGSRNSSIASVKEKNRSNTILSRDCFLGPDNASMELKNEIVGFKAENCLPLILNKRTKLLKEMPYTEILKLEKSEISKPLLIMEDVNDIETAKQMFRNLLSYMKLRKSSKEPILHAKKYLRLVRQASPILKDEAYLQVYKQLHNNHEYESFMSAYKMLGILSSCFVPDNKNIYLFILQYLYNEMRENRNNLVLNHIKYIFTRMLKTKEHERKNIPCKEELEFIEYLRPIPINVYLFDGTKVNINVESYTSIKELKEKAINSLFLDIQNSMNYCIYEICTKTNGIEERFIDDSERVCDIMSVWKSEMDKDMKKKIDSFFRFYLRILIFSPLEKDDTETLSIVYHQNSHDVIVGRFPLNVDKAITLASLQLFNEFLEDNIRAKQALEENLERYVPKNKIKTVSLGKEEWVRSIFNKYSEFIGKVTRCIFNEELTQIVFYEYEIIINWGISKDQFILCMPTDTSLVKRVCFLTSQTKVIQTVIEVYCSIKAGKSKKTIKEIIDGYDERFKSIDASKKVKDLVHRSGTRGSNFTESDYKLMNDVDSIHEFVNDDEIFKGRATNAMIRINDINTKKTDNENAILLEDQ